MSSRYANNQPEITTAALPNGTKDSPYQGNLVASGGDAPLFWSLSGAPVWLSVDPQTAALTGTPTATGNYQFSATVSDADGDTDTALLSIFVDPPIPVGTPPPANHWDFEGNGANEVSGKPALSLKNNPSFSTDAATGGQSLVLNGVNQYATLSTALGAQTTVAVWMQLPAGITGEKVILANRGLNATNSGMILRINQNRVELDTSDGNTSIVAKSGNNTIAYDGLWHHLAVTIDQVVGEAFFYLDGAPITGPSSLIHTSFPLTGGFLVGRPVNNARYFEGKLDDLRVYDELLTEPQIATLSGAVSLPPDADLLMRLGFEGIGTDDSGNDNHLWYLITPVYSTDSAVGTQSLVLNGSGKPAVLYVDLGQNFSVATWVKLAPGTSGTSVLLGNKGTVPTNSGLLLRLTTDRLEFQIGNGTVAATAASNAGVIVRDGEWHHIGVTVDGGAGQARLFVDGVDVTGTSGSVVNGFNTNVGNFGSPANSTQFFTGGIDDFRIYNRSLLGSEINALYLEDSE